MDFLTAAKNGDLQRLQVLLEQGVDKDITDDDGWTALFRSPYKVPFFFVILVYEASSFIFLTIL